MSRTKLSYCGDLQYSIWRKADDSTPYGLDEHEEMPYDIDILIRYVVEKEQIVKEMWLTVEADEVMSQEDDDLRTRIDETLEGFGVGSVNDDDGVRREMVDVLMMKVWDKGVSYCRCYCGLGCGPTIVMEIAKPLDDAPPCDER